MTPRDELEKWHVDLFNTLVDEFHSSNLTPGEIADVISIAYMKFCRAKKMTNSDAFRTMYFSMHSNIVKI